MPRKEYELENPDFDYDEELDAIDDQELEGEIIDEIDANIDSAADKKKPEKAEPEIKDQPEPEKDEPKKEAEKPVAEEKPIEEIKPVEEVKPIQEGNPVEEVKPIQEEKPEKQDEKEQNIPKKEEAQDEPEQPEEEIDPKKDTEKKPEKGHEKEPEEVEFSFGDEDEIEDQPEDDLQQKLEDIKDRRRQLEQEEAEYQKNKELQNQAELNKKKAPKPNEPEAEAKKDVNKPEAKDKKTTVLKNPYLGTVNAQGEINESLLDKQRKEVHSLRAMMYYVTDGEKRPEFTLVKKQLYNLESFLARTAGRKKLNKKEMETYELLTMKAYKATAFYDKAMEKEEEALRAKGGSFTKKDIKRLNAMDRIRESVSQMRSNMYEKEMQRKKEAMQKKCEEKVQNMKETLDGLNHARYKDSQLREILTGAVVRTIFFMNRMDSLEKSIRLHPGESVKKSTKRMNRDLRPTRQDMDRTAKMELTQSIVDAGMKEIKAGNTFSTDDIVRLQKMYIQKNAARLAANRKRRKNLQNLKNRKSIRVPESGMKK